MYGLALRVAFSIALPFCFKHRNQVLAASCYGAGKAGFGWQLVRSPPAVVLRRCINWSMLRLSQLL